jgi:AcrR family transcriptional regulator
MNQVQLFCEVKKLGTEERRKREREQRNEEILKAAKKVFFTKGFNDTTMDDIARESELSKGTLYLYFKNKEDLAHAIMFESFKFLKNMMEDAVGDGGTGMEKIKRIVSVMPVYYDRYRSYFDFARNIDYRIASRAEESNMAAQCMRIIDEIVDMLISVLREGVQDNTIRTDIDPEKMAILYANIVTSFMTQLSVLGDIINQRGQYEPGELIEHMLDIMVRSLW